MKEVTVTDEHANITKTFMVDEKALKGYKRFKKKISLYRYLTLKANVRPEDCYERK